MGVIISDGYIPSLGASGAIAGIMGAYLFLYSGEKILTLVGTILPLNGCTLPLIFPLWLPAWVFIIYTFLNDALWGQLVIDVTNAGQYLHLGVGVFAHVGGAFGGMLFITLFLHPEVLAHQR